ncbi:MAG: TFIIB-type zinc ribbon-containing protein [Clostridiales bacterium]|mgnify:CR=1 FL=1|nr:TFIIB-type zinc ribbon-containing protein [Clostridiales bacterium]
MAVVSYKCPHCGGELIFSPTTQKYKCEYCLSDFSQEELEALKPEEGSEEKAVNFEEDTQEENTTEKETQEEAVIYHCPSCGAEIVTDETTAATFCYYCHNPVVLSGRVSGEFLPDKIIPFAIDKKQATEKFLDYVHSKKFVPKAFFNKQQIEKISGVYFPYWMVDMDMEGSMQAEGRNVRVWRSGDTEYTETKVYRVEREGDVHLEDITKNALKKSNAKLAEGVLPYDVSKVQKFHMGFLSGFLAEKRDIERTELNKQVQQEANEYGEKILRGTVKGYSSISVKSCHLNQTQENWDYTMLPVWTVTYKGKNGKMYYYSMNGQDGKVYGELPIDYKKVWILGGIVFGLVLILALIGGYLL